MSPLQQEYPSHAQVPPKFTRGPMTSVAGTYAGPPLGAVPMPSALGGTTDLAGALEGFISDMRAASTETKNTMKDLSIMAQRITTMLGGTPGLSGMAPKPNSVLSLGSGANASNLETAIASVAMGMSYGSGMGAAPQGVQAYDPNIAGPVSNKSFEAFKTTPLSPSTNSVPTAQTSGPVAGSGSAPAPNAVPTAPTSWTKARTNAPLAKEAESSEVKDLAAGAAAEKLLTPKGADEIAKQKARQADADFARGKAAALTPTSQNIGKFLSKYVGEVRPGQTSGLRVAVSAAAEGEGGAGILTGLVGSSVADFAGPAGLAVGGGLAVAHELSSQRAANAAIQSQIGGSNISAVGTRIQGLGFGLENLGTMSMGESNQLFTGVTDLGLQGGTRQNALDFAMQQYRDLGVSVSDSLQLISVSSKAGHDNLQALAGVLDAVTNSAAAASVNTEQARQNFTAMYQRGISNGMSATASAQFAGGSTILANQLGKTGQGVSYGNAPNAAAAGALGMSLNDYEAGIAMGGYKGAAVQASGQQAIMMQIAGGGMGASGLPGIKALANQAYTQQQGGSGAFAQAMMRQGHVLPQQLMQNLTAAGVNGVTASNVWEIAAGIMSDHTNLKTATTQSAALGSVNSFVSKNATGDQGMSALGKFLFSQTGSEKNTRWLEGAKTNIDKYITNHGSNNMGSQNLMALLEHGQGGSIQVGGQTLSVNQALATPGLLGKIEAGKGNFINSKGKKDTIDQFSSSHGGIVSGGSSSGQGRSVGTVTIVPSATLLQLFGFNTSGGVTLSQAQQTPTQGYSPMTAPSS